MIPSKHRVGSRQLEINIGKGCNNECVFCGNGTVPAPDKRFVPLEMLQREVDIAAAEGYRAVGLLGGEPTLHPDLVALVSYARSASIQRISLCTNGRRLRNLEYLWELVAAGVTRITISLHHHRREVAEELSKRPGSFDQQVQAVQNVVAGLASGSLSLPDGFAVNSCIHGRNLRSLTTLAKFLQGLGVSDLRLNGLRPEHRAVGNAELVPRLTGVTRAIEKVVLWNEQQGGMRITFSDLPWCVYPTPFFVNPNLLRRYVGDLQDLDTFVTAFRGEQRRRDNFQWKQRRTHRLKEKVAACERCRVEPQCEGVWKRYREIHGDAGIEPVR